MSEQDTAAEATVEDAPEASEDTATTATAVIDPPAEDTVAQTASDEAEADAEAEAPADDLEPAAAAPVVVAGVRTARVFVCECGYRTVAIWGEPQTCQAPRSRRHGDTCGKPLYALEQVPEKVQKALNPLKASKKKAKGKD